MNKVKIKKRLFGYKLQDFDQYINDIKTYYSTDLDRNNKRLEEEIELLKKKIIILETRKQSDDLIENIHNKEIKEVQKSAHYWRKEYENLKKHTIELDADNSAINHRLNSYNQKEAQDYKYKFTWDLIGDIAKGRPSLGNLARVEVYRLMQFTIKDILVKEFGTDKTELIFYQAGKIAGKAFYENMLTPEKDLDGFINQVKTALLEVGIGILEVESVDMEIGELILTVSEDLDCSGISNIGYEICTYDEGFIAGLIGSFTGTTFHVKEIACWGTNDRICRFHAVAEL